MYNAPALSQGCCCTCLGLLLLPQCYTTLAHQCHVLICSVKEMEHVEPNTISLQLVGYTVWRARISLAHVQSFDYKTWTFVFLGPKAALDDLFLSNSAFPELIELLSVDSPVESKDTKVLYVCMYCTCLGLLLYLPRAVAVPA